MSPSKHHASKKAIQLSQPLSQSCASRHLLKQWSFARTDTVDTTGTRSMFAQPFSFPFRVGLHLPWLCLGSLWSHCPNIFNTLTWQFWQRLQFSFQMATGHSHLEEEGSKGEIARVKLLATLTENWDYRGTLQEQDQVSIPLHSFPTGERNQFLFIATFSLVKETQAKIMCWMLSHCFDLRARCCSCLITAHWVTIQHYQSLE